MMLMSEIQCIIIRVATRSWILLSKKKNKDVFFPISQTFSVVKTLCTFSSSYLLGNCNGEGKGHCPNNIIDRRGLAVACDVMRLVTGVWSILIKALSELLGSLKEKKYGWKIGGIYIQRKRGGDRNVLVYTWIIFFFELS